MLLKVLSLKILQNCFFFTGSLIHVFVGTGAGILLIFIRIIIFFIRKKQKQAHTITDMKDNSIDFRKKFFIICKKKSLKFIFTTQMYFYTKL